jgi:hypothetical protein
MGHVPMPMAVMADAPMPLHMADAPMPERAAAPNGWIMEGPVPLWWQCGAGLPNRSRANVVVTTSVGSLLLRAAACCCVSRGVLC